MSAYLLIIVQREGVPLNGLIVATDIQEAFNKDLVLFRPFNPEKELGLPIYNFASYEP